MTERERRSLIIECLRELVVPTLILTYTIVHFWQVEQQGRFTASLSVRVLLVSIVLLGGVVAIGLISKVVRRSRGADVDVGFASATEEYGDDDSIISWTTTSFAASVLAYIALLPVLGFLLSTVLFVAIATALLGSRSIVSLVVVPITLTVSTYLIFGSLLNIRLPVGRLFG